MPPHTRARASSVLPYSSKIPSLEVALGLCMQMACSALSQSQGFIPKKLLECFVLIRFKQLRQGKLHNPFSKFQTLTCTELLFLSSCVVAFCMEWD